MKAIKFLFVLLSGLFFLGLNVFASSKNLLKTYGNDQAYKNAMNKVLAGDNFVGSGVIKRKSGKIIKQFMFEIRNKTGLAHKLAITPAYLDTLRICPLDAVTHKYTEIGGGTILGSVNTESEVKHNSPTKFAQAGVAGVTAVLADGIIYSVTNDTDAFTITPKGFAIHDFLEYVSNNPCVIDKISISCQNASFFDGEIRVKTINPFDNSGDKQLQLGDFLDLNQQVQTRIDVIPAKKNMVVQLDNQTVLTMTIPAQLAGVSDVKATIQIDICEVGNYAEEAFAGFGGSEE